MIEFEYNPVVIEAHRNDLRTLFNHPPAGVERPTRRQQLGALIVRLGHWVEDRCVEAATETPVALPAAQARG